MRTDENGNTFIKSEAQFSFELEGESSISVDTLTDILNNTVEIVNQIVRGEPDTYVNLKITKFSTGSFDIYFHAVAEQIQNIITEPETVAAGIVAAVSGVFGLVKHLGGKRPKKIDEKDGKAEIINYNGDVFYLDIGTTNKFFKSDDIETAIMNINNDVKEDAGRTGFILRSETKEGEKVIKYTVDDINTVAPVVNDMLDDTQDLLINEVEATLIIRKPDLVGNSKWGFIYNTNIDAAIEDKEWLEKVRAENIKFGKNMRLPVRLRIETKVSFNGEVIGDTTYTITKVTGDIIDGETDNQMSII